MLADPSGLSERVLGGVDRSRGGNLVAGHDLQNRARGSRAWGPSAGGGFRAVSPRGLARCRLDFGQVRPSMSEQACQKPFLAYLKVRSYVDI